MVSHTVREKSYLRHTTNQRFRGDSLRKAEESLTNLEIGDIVEAEWLNTHSTNRITRSQTKEIEEFWARCIRLKKETIWSSLMRKLCSEQILNRTVEFNTKGFVRKWDATD